MAKVTRIKAKDPESKKASSPKEKTKKPVKAAAKVAEKPAKEAKKPAEAKSAKAIKVAKKKQKQENYFKGAWKEIRQVRWPNRKATWKMFLAVVVYAAIFMVVILLLDLLFEWIFKLILA